MLFAAAPPPASAQTLSTLFSFDNANGAHPLAVLNQATTGNLYGTTPSGGTHGDYGTAFEIISTGILTLHNFCSQAGCTDGEEPWSAPVQATDGNFYGTTYVAGLHGAGTVFKMSPTGTLTTLYTFCSKGGCSDGAESQSSLVQATDGNLYGTTSFGGTGSACGSTSGCGTVFKISLSGKLTTLYSFCSQSRCPDGYRPEAGLVQARDGNFYGTTYYGGSNGGGTAFKITPSGTLITLHSFCSQRGCGDGEYPSSTLVQAIDGNLYGTTPYGGTTEGGGTIFRINPGGTLTTLYSFCSQRNCTDGKYPAAALTEATNRSLYGTTFEGGTNDSGTIFQITSSGVLTTLYSFCLQSNCADGANPYAALVQDTSGKFYGTTDGGGDSGGCDGGCGTIFSLDAGLGPFVETQTTSGKVGATVKILGTNLTGATSVTFNGTPATFKVFSASEITTTVPSGATSGTVQVTLPSETLSSNIPFRVNP